MKLRQTIYSALFCGALTLGFACGDDSDDGHEDSGLECNSSLTYAQDIAPIIKTNCLSCHSKTVTGVARAGAPSDHNFDTEADVKSQLDHIEHAAVVEKSMPPGGLPEDARQKLGTWIACQ